MGAVYLLKAAGVFAAVMAVALPYRRTHHPFERFGLANAVTTTRAALVALVALIGDSAGASLAGTATVIASIAAASLLALTWSFAVDVRWLWASRQTDDSR